MINVNRIKEGQTIISSAAGTTSATSEKEVLFTAEEITDIRIVQAYHTRLTQGMEQIRKGEIQLQQAMAPSGREELVEQSALSTEESRSRLIDPSQAEAAERSKIMEDYNRLGSAIVSMKAELEKVTGDSKAQLEVALQDLHAEMKRVAEREWALNTRIFERKRNESPA